MNLSFCKVRQVAMAAEIGDAFAQSNTTLRLDRVNGYAHLFSHLLLRETVDLAQGHDLAATIGQRLDGMDQMLDFFPMGHLLRRAIHLVDDTQGIDLSGAPGPLIFQVAQLIERKIS